MMRLVLSRIRITIPRPCFIHPCRLPQHNLEYNTHSYIVSYEPVSCSREVWRRPTEEARARWREAVCVGVSVGLRPLIVCCSHA